MESPTTTNTAQVVSTPKGPKECFNKMTKAKKLKMSKDVLAEFKKVNVVFHHRQEDDDDNNQQQQRTESCELFEGLVTALLSFEKVIETTIRPNSNGEQQKVMEDPLLTSYCLILTRMLQKLHQADTEKCVKLRNALNLNKLIPKHLPDSIFDLSRVRPQGAPTLDKENSLSMVPTAVTPFTPVTPVVTRVITPVHDSHDKTPHQLVICKEIVSSSLFTEEEIQTGKEVINAMMGVSPLNESTTLLVSQVTHSDSVPVQSSSSAVHVQPNNGSTAEPLIQQPNDDSDNVHTLITPFEKTLMAKQKELTGKLARRPGRSFTSVILLGGVLAAFSHLIKNKAGMEIFSDKYDNCSSSKTQATIENARADVINGLCDFVQSLLLTMLDSELSKERAFLNIKIPIIREFIDSIRNKHFTPLRLCKMLDTALRQNTCSISQMRRLLNVCIKATDQTIDDITNNTSCPGGKKENRLNMICSNAELMVFRRLLEAVANKLLGAKKSLDEAGAKISVSKFVLEYFRSIYRVLNKEKYFENGICKIPICIDITNDGSSMAGYPFNIGGLKFFPYVLDDDDDAKQLLHDMTVCVILSIFIGKDDTKNVERFHYHMYDFFQSQKCIKKVGKDHFITVKVAENETVQFKLEYCFSGDMKSHGQACGDASLGAASTTQAVYCCACSNKVTAFAPNSEKCGICISQKVPIGTPCYHELYCRTCFELPEKYNSLQSAITMVKDQVMLTQTEIDNHIADTKARKKQKANNGKEVKINNDVLPDDINQFCESDHGINGKYIAWIDLSNMTADRMYADTKRRIAERIFGFAPDISNLKGDNLDNALEIGPTGIKQVTLYDIDYIEGAERAVYNTRRDICINKATLQDLVTCIKVRICHTKSQYDQLDNVKQVNERLIQILEETYGVVVDKDIKDCNNMETQCRKLVQILLVLEKYVVYFIKDYNKKVVSKGLVSDRLRLLVCDLHMEMRIVLTLLQDLLNNCVMDRYKPEFAKGLIEHMQHWISNNIFRDADSTSQASDWHIPVDKNTVTQITLQNVKVDKLLVKSDALIDEILNYKKDEQQANLKTKDIVISYKCDANAYREIFSGFLKLLTSLRKFNKSNSDDDYEKWQVNEVDPWFRRFLRMFGWSHCGHYVHFLARGHILEQLKEFRNIHMHSQQNWEGQIGIIKQYIGTHTQRGGNSCGGKDRQKKVQESLLSSLLRYMLRSAMYVLFPDEAMLKQIIEDVKKELAADETGLKYVEISDRFIDDDPVEASLQSVVTNSTVHDGTDSTLTDDSNVAAQFDGLHLDSDYWGDRIVERV
jgi:hypothetical protein